MKYIIYVLLIISIFSMGCQRRLQVNPHYRTIINNLEKDNFYKKMLDLYIIQRSGENYYMCLNDIKFEFEPVLYTDGEQAYIYSNSRRYLLNELEKISYKNSENYLQEIERRCSEVIPFMEKNGIVGIDGVSTYKKVDFDLEIYLENSYNIYLTKTDLDSIPKVASYQFIEKIDEWLVYIMPCTK